MVSVTYSAQLGTSIPSFVTGITDLEIAWINGQPRLYAAARPGPGAGYSVFDLSAASGPASLVAVQGYIGAVHHNTTPQIAIFGNTTGSAGNLIAAGLAPSGWASHSLTAQGDFGATLNSAFAFDPTAVTGLAADGVTYVYLAPEGASQPLAFQLADTGAMTAVAGTFAATGPTLDSMSVAQTGGGNFLLTASAAGNELSSYAIGTDGALTLAGQITTTIGTGFSKPTAVASVTVHGITYVIAAGSESSSLSVFRLLPDGGFYEADHVVDNLATRFSGATAMATLEIGGRAFVLAGGADDGVEVMTLLPDGRLIQLLTIADTGALSLADVTSIAATQIGGRTQVFVASASEPGIAQLDLDLGPLGISVFQAPGVQTGTGNNDLLVAGTGTTALYGGNGDDIVVAGGPGGAAVLYGGAGSDVFVLSPSAAVIQIADYRPGVDRLDLTSFPLLRNLGQLTITTTASGADITYLGTTIHVESFDGNPIPLTAFAQSQMLRLDRFSPVATTTLTLGSSGADTLTATSEDTSLLGLDGNDSLIGGGGNDHLEGNLGNDTLRGGLGGDFLSGDLGNDSLFGEDGHDVLDGASGNDLIDGGTGDDTLSGGAGSDSIVGMDGNDLLYGGFGLDTLHGGAGGNFLDGGADDDFLYGGLGGETILGGDGNDYVVAADGDDSLLGGSGNDALGGQAGNDTIYGGAGDDAMSGVEGDDQLYGDTGNDLLWDTFGNDSLYGGTGLDTLYGGEGRNILDGGPDRDFLYGGINEDVIFGGDGNDYVVAAAGADTIWGGNGNDALGGQTGDDVIYGGGGDDAISGIDGNDQLFGDTGNDLLWDTLGHDSLYGGAGVDTLYGGEGRNHLDGGTENDFLYGGVNEDVIFGGDGNDYVVAAAGADTIWGGNGNDALGGQTGDDVIYGGGGNDALSGAEGNDQLYGDTGNDLLWDTFGNDSLYGGTGLDTLYGGQGRNCLDGGTENDFLYGGVEGDAILGGDGNDYVVAAAGADTIWGGDGSDVIRGGAGADRYFGGAGSDVFVFGNSADIGLWATADRIHDFTPGQDKISFSGMGLRFGGAGSSGSKLELRYVVSGPTLILHADVTGDGVTDFSLLLDNVAAVSASDFYF